MTDPEPQTPDARSGVFSCPPRAAAAHDHRPIRPADRARCHPENPSTEKRTKTAHFAASRCANEPYHVRTPRQDQNSLKSSENGTPAEAQPDRQQTTRPPRPGPAQVSGTPAGRPTDPVGRCTFHRFAPSFLWWFASPV